MSQRLNPTQQLIKAIRVFLKDRFNLSEGKASERETIEYIKQGVVFRGANLWILIFAIMVCSIGLQFNNIAVIIGAMLISPLMGPIMGVGLGTGTNDFQLIIKSMKNLGIAVAMSVAASALYFWISPFESSDQSELLSRTAPTLWDVLIATFGGFAGIVAGSRKEKSNAIPGVAIATALMPPLCTAGYGLAVPEGLTDSGGPSGFEIFIGAMYLFFINSVFISISTYIIVKVLRFRKKEFVDAVRERRVRLYVAAFVLITILPSGYTAFHVVQEARFKSHALDFIKNELDPVLGFSSNPDVSYNEHGGNIEIINFGTALTPDQIAELREKLAKYQLEGCRLDIQQTDQEEDIVNIQMLEQYNQQLRMSIIEDLYRKDQEVIQNKDDRIAFLEEQLLRYRRGGIPVEDIATEARAINKKIKAISLDQTEVYNVESLTMDTIFLAIVNLDRRPTQSEQQLLKEWLNVRTKADTLRLILEYPR